jgi:hypothetical protein
MYLVHLLVTNGDWIVEMHGATVKVLYISVIKTHQLILYKEIVAVFSEIHIKHINRLCGQNVIFFFKLSLVLHVVTARLSMVQGLNCLVINLCRLLTQKEIFSFSTSIIRNSAVSQTNLQMKLFIIANLRMKNTRKFKIQESDKFDINLRRFDVIESISYVM